ncbi:linear amide C-N hydrolase [Arsenicicoccus sp. oral taxon 190]|uniref:linear amide C-N hydrolase n=1 Tax=Arsenicicoccus sp. oral taxon 190 TaxID=1658671 RepID=UPI00067C00AD|nr:linear amide C-N hydrolase [Arsenicicoccus sp. oral taxon 190]
MDVTRRSVLAAGLATAATGLAGCGQGARVATVIGVSHSPGTELEPGASLPTTASPPPIATPASPATAGGPPGGAAAPFARPLVTRQTAAQERATLASWRTVGSPPLHELSWAGEAAHLDPASAEQAGAAAERLPFGCTIFVAAGDHGRVVVGRNFDWDPNPAAVIRSRATGGPRSIGMCDLSFCDLPQDQLGRLGEPDVRRRLLRAHGRVVDGVNEHGLFIGLAQDPEGRSEQRPGTAPVGGVGIVRLVLDRCRDVPAAADLMSRCSLDFTGGPALHYLLADRSGASATVELVDGRPRIEERGRGVAWQCLENFQLASTPVAARAAHPRYARVPGGLERQPGPAGRGARAAAARRGPAGPHAVVGRLRPDGGDGGGAAPDRPGGPPLPRVSALIVRARGSSAQRLGWRLCERKGNLMRRIIVGTGLLLAGLWGLQRERARRAEDALWAEATKPV